MAIDRKTVEHVARLARLELPPETLALYEKQLGAILDYIAKLETLDVAGVEPLVHPADAPGAFREDVPRPGLSQSEALKNAPDRTDEFFIVPKVVS